MSSFAEAAVHGLSDKARLERCGRSFDEQTVGHRLIVGDHDEEGGSHSTPKELALDRVDDLSFVQLLAGQAGDAFSLLQKRSSGVF